MIEIRFNENNEITIECNIPLIKDDIIKIINEITKLQTID
jgi:hypothetical protein